MNELTAPFGGESKREPNSLISERFSLQFDLGFNFKISTETASVDAFISRSLTANCSAGDLLRVVKSRRRHTNG